MRKIASLSFFGDRRGNSRKCQQEMWCLTICMRVYCVMQFGGFSFNSRLHFYRRETAIFHLRIRSFVLFFSSWVFSMHFTQNSSCHAFSSLCTVKREICELKSFSVAVMPKKSVKCEEKNDFAPDYSRYSTCLSSTDRFHQLWKCLCWSKQQKMDNQSLARGPYN